MNHVSERTTPPTPERILPDMHKVGMIAFFASEFAFFGTLIMTYVIFLGQRGVPPTPAEALSLPLVLGTTFCLLSSSLTIHLADTAHRAGARGGFILWWGATCLLGGMFLAGTAYEWHELITRHGLTIGRNLFGSTYYTLVGFHALHVTVGLILLLMILRLFVARRVKPIAVELVSWYWHFVDVVWVVVFLVVYVVGR